VLGRRSLRLNGDVNAMESFECREGFGAFGFPKVNFNRGNGVRDEL
jgi:hypothetical protein